MYDHNTLEPRTTDARRKRWVAGVSTAVLVAIALLVICYAPQAQGQEAPALPTDAEIAQMERDLRDACELRRKAAQDAGDDVARQAWLLRRRMVEAAISARVLQEALVVEDQPGPPSEPEPVEPPDNPDLPDRIERGAIKNQSAADFEIERPERAIEFDDDGVPTKWAATAGAWLDVYPRTFQLPYELRNGVIHDYGPYPGKPGWDHAIYANNAHLFLHDVWLYGPTHLESRGRSHPIYLNGSSLTASRLLIGNHGDTFPHTISINIAGGDGVSNGPQPVDIDTLVVIGGRRVVIEADDGTLSRLHIGRLIVIDPVTADGLWEGVEVEGCPDIEIGEYVVIDTAGRWSTGALIKADDCQGEVGRAVIYAPNAPPSEALIRGVDGAVERLDAPPAGELPGVTGPESIEDLVVWATQVPTIYSTGPAAGTAPAKIVYSHQLYDHGRLDTTRQPPADKIEAVMLGDVAGLVVLDFEAPSHPVAGNAHHPNITDAEVAAAQDRVAQIIASMRQRQPRSVIVCYGTPGLLSADVDGVDQDWARLLDSPLADAVDGWAISGYHYGDVTQMRGWGETITRTVEAAAATGKPVYVVVNHRHRGEPAGDLVPVEVWRDMLAVLRGLGVRVILWQHPDALMPEAYIAAAREVHDA